MFVYFSISFTVQSVSECRSVTDFKCNNNLCLPSIVKCDGYDHCGDGSDEAELCGALRPCCVSRGTSLFEKKL